MEKQPLVSCLCVSNGRPKHLRNAIDYFNAQTYANKELLIVSRNFDPEYQAIIDNFSGKSMRYLNPEFAGNMTLGELRNFSIEQALGEYVCIWDDDDWYHCKRIEFQVSEAMTKNKQGSVLPYYILYNSIQKEAYMSTPLPPPASTLCKQAFLTKDFLYEPLNKAEDDSFIEKLNKLNILLPVVNPILYIYIFHGQNTWHQDHFMHYCGRKFSAASSAFITDVVSNKYSCQEASGLLERSDILQEFDYFHAFSRTHQAI